MTKKHQPIGFVIICLTIIALGFWAGQRFITAPNHKKEHQYIGVFPSTGPLTIIKNLSVLYEGDFAIANIEQTDLNDIKIGKKVVLYDDESVAMPLGGTVHHFTTQNEQLNVFIKLPEGTNTEFLANIVGVITTETNASQRLPLSAIQTDQNDRTFIWVATQTSSTDLYTLKKKDITIGIQDDRFFEPRGFHQIPDGLTIINPDKKINTETPYDVLEEKLNAPLHNPIKQAWIDYELYRLEHQQIELKEIAEKCAQGTQEPQSGNTNISSASSCGTSANHHDPLFQAFQSLTQPDHDHSHEGSCGSNSCGQ